MPDSPTDYTPGSFGCHEALHTVSIIDTMFDRHVLGHPAIEDVPEWREKAIAISEAIGELYQMIGLRHLEAVPPGEAAARFLLTPSQPAT